MRNYFIIQFLIIITFSTYSEAQFVQDNESIMVNIELLNKKISGLNSRANSLKTELTSLRNDLMNLNLELNENDKILNNRIDSLLIELDRLNQDYQITMEKLKLYIKVENDLQNVVIDKAKEDIILLSDELIVRCQQLDDIEKKLSNLPDIYTNPDAIPWYGANISLVKFVTFGQSNLYVEPGYSIGAKYRFNHNSCFWSDYTTPFVLTLSSYNSVLDVKINDKWTSQLISAGYSYHNTFSNSSNFNYVLSGGLFYGFVQYDRFADNTVDIDRNNVHAVNTLGADIKLGISYNQFDLKNPFEIYLHFNNMISSKNIVLVTDNENKFDMGAYLFSVSLGINFWFW